VPLAAKFCAECGARVAEKGSVAQPPDDATPVPSRTYTPKHLADRILQSRSAVEGERKQVTVMFADVTGSMALAEALDAEEWHDILDRFFAILAEGVHRYEGTVNQYTGDGIMALFGAPLSHEDHAQRACFAALRLQDELARYATEVKRTHGVGFSTRIGLNSGEVIVGKIGDDLRMDYTAQGHVVGLAQRMEQLASPDTCYLTEKTAALVDGYCAIEDLGDFTIKGATDPLRVYRLVGSGSATTRLDISRARGLTRFVGRETDLATLENALEQAQNGHGQVVGVVAAAGTGKSRLCHEFAQRCRARGLVVNEGHALAHAKSIPFLPIRQVFRTYFGVGERDDDAAVREKIAGRLLLLDEGFREVLPVIFEFLLVPDPERPVPRMDPDAKQRQLFEVVRRVARDPRAGATRVVALLEDLHWLDPASEEMLAQWVDAIAGSSGLLLVNFRPDYRADWMQQTHYRQIPLSPLGPEAIRALVRDLLGSDASIAGLAEQIHQQSGGNPFFAEEIVQSLVESGSLRGEQGSYRLTTPLARIDVPPSVQALLGARIDRLPDREKRVLQTAAVIGKQLDETLLRRVLDTIGGAEWAGDDLSAAIAVLKSREFLFETAVYPVPAYAFKHPLTQEVALHSQLRERRRQAHAAVADAIEEMYSEKLDEWAALLAHHSAEAGRALAAARWHARAARFVASSDFAAAGRHWQAVRELVRDAADDADAAVLGAEACFSRLALALRLELGEEDARAVFDEGIDWARRRGDERLAARIHWPMAVYTANTARIDEALEHAAAWGRVARGLDEPDLRAMALWPTLEPLALQGDLERHRSNALQQVEWTRDHPHWGLRDWGISAYVGGLIELARNDLNAGSLAEARKHLGQVIESARSMGDPEMEAYAADILSFGGWLALDPDWGSVAVRQSFTLEARLGQNARLSIYLGLARQLLLEGEAQQAVDTLERVRSLRGATLQKYEARRASVSAQALVALGRAQPAREIAEAGLEIARERGNRLEAIDAALTLAAALRGIASEECVVRLGETLRTAETLIAETGARNLEPLLLVERGREARLRGDEDAGLSLLRRAREGFAALGAPGRVRALDAERARS
jgi:class 3 adenylate cyclase